MNKVRNVRLAGISACVPKKQLSVYHRLKLEPSEIERVKSMIGVSERRISSSSQCSSDLCFVACEKLLADLSWTREEINFLIFITQTPDYRLPGNAFLLQHRLGLPTSCITFDINLGCSAYVYGLYILASLIATEEKKKGLLLVGDTPTKFISPSDRTTALLFGDAGTATALEYKEGQEDWFFSMGGNGAKYDKIMIHSGGYRNPVTPNSFKMKKIDKGIFRNQLHLVLDGIEVFNFSIKEPIKSIENTLVASNRIATDIDFYVFHQANKIINKQIQSKMKIPDNLCPSTLSKYGNTSAASIPLTMASEIGNLLRSEKLTLLICGFGVGLSWGSVILKTDNVVCPEVIEQ